MTIKEARAIAEKLGLLLGGCGHAFAGDYGNKGLYAYSAGKYRGCAYFGTGGTPEQMRVPAYGNHRYRPWNVGDPNMPADVIENVERIIKRKDTKK